MKSLAIKLLGTMVFLLLVSVMLDSPVLVRGKALHALSTQTSIGRVWHVTEYGGWTATWTRRGDSMVFDGLWLNGTQKATGVVTMTVQGSTVRIQSRQQTNGYDVDYEGTLSQDGRSIRGSLWVVGSGTRQNWQAAIDTAGVSIQPPPPPPPPQPTQTSGEERAANIAGTSSPANARVPDFGALDAGGMPPCLIELSPQAKSSGWILNANTPYTVWAAPKIEGVQFGPSAWRPFGPFTFSGRQRMIFNWDGASHGGRMANNIEITGTTPILSPALASLHVQNFDGNNVWVIPNPLLPGCDPNTGGNSKWDKPIGTTPPTTAATNPAANISGAWYSVNPGINRRGNASIEQSGDKLVFINEVGDRSSGHFAPGQTNVVIASDWGNLQGTLVNNGTRINWANDTYWTKR
jgi:hypothetical protein